MPIGYRVDYERRLVFIRGWDTVSEADVRAQALALQKCPPAVSKFNVLVDLRDLVAPGLTIDFFRTFPTSFERGSRRAVVAGNVYVLAMAHVYCAWVAGEDAAVVTRDMMEALDWLELPPSIELPGELDAAFPWESSGLQGLHSGG